MSTKRAVPLAMLLVIATVLASLIPPAGAAPPEDGRSVAVIVQKLTVGDGRPEAAVHRLGGRVTRDLPLVDGFAAVLPAGALARLGSSAGVRAVTPDRPVSVQSSVSGDSRPSVFPAAVRADAAWDRGFTGRSVTVALIDTGVADVPDLAGRIVPVTDATGRVRRCVNLSGEAGCHDTYGHGTFMAGLIAGTGASSDGAHRGIAPGARVVSIKIAGRDGSADVSNVLAAIQWVVSFRHEYGIKVLNLSLGTDSTQSHTIDPLNYAVQRAWAAGITVVVSASNNGPAPGTIAKPGDDPWVVTAGAIDDRGTADIADDTLPNFTSRGPTVADGVHKPDVAAPGASLVSLRSPGSTLDERFPSSMGDGYRRGSGTSMSAAVVTGAVALLLEAKPDLTPNRVKHALASTARPVASEDHLAVGSGIIDVSAALAAPLGEANAGLHRSSGLGRLDASRGSLRVQTNDPAATVVTGLHTAQLLLWDSDGFTTGRWTPTTWNLTAWQRSAWPATAWSGSNWNGSNWNGSNWNGSNWNGSTFYGAVDAADTYGSSGDGSVWYGAWD
jgi:serine protease AprX